MSIEKAIEKLKKLKEGVFPVRVEIDAVINELKQALPKKEWEPSGGEFSIASYGIITEGWNGGDEEKRLYGNYFKEKSHAEVCSKMTRRNNWILQAKIEIGAGDGRYVLTNSDKGEWLVSMADWQENRELGCETREQAERVLEMVRPVLGGV